MRNRLVRFLENCMVENQSSFTYLCDQSFKLSEIILTRMAKREKSGNFNVVEEKQTFLEQPV